MRRYLFKLYPTAEQEAALHEQRKMIADLWNALLQRYEDIQRRTVQRQIWFDAAGKRRVGRTLHNPEWDSVCRAAGELVRMPPGQNGLPKPFTAFDMQNEITHLCNVMPEWRALSVWCGHRTAGLLDRAIQAFYRRAKQGAGAQSGYPRYKRRNRHDSIPHRSLSGCRLRKDPRHENSWGLSLKGIDNPIHARGALPADVIKWADADVMFRDGLWWFSVCVEMVPRRQPGYRPVVVAFDLLDSFAAVDGFAETPDGLAWAQELQDRRDVMQSEHDKRWPRGRRYSDDEWVAMLESKRELSRLSARIKRVRSDALHVWTTRIVARASDLTIIAPPIKPRTASPRGDEKQWGANVEVVSDLNRNTLSQAPATAVAMLKYKAEEAGIRCDVVTDEAPKIGVGGDLVSAGKQLRRARRELRRAA